VAIAFVWIVCCGGLVKKCVVEKQELDGEEVVAFGEDKAKCKQKTKIDKSFIVLFAILAFFAIVNNFVKDGLTTWTPTILKEKYSLDNSISLVLTVMLPMFALMGAMLAIKLNKKFKNYVSLCGICYFIAMVIIALLILCLGLNTWVITLVCFMFVSMVMAGVNNILTSIFPLQCKNVNAGLVAGLIDGFCYVGSALSSYGLGAIAQNTGNWDVIMYLFAGLSALCVLMVVIYGVVNRLKKAKTNKIG
jgi:OPA family glycerol-3-phosphate transporter-like MFS transporter